MEVLHDRFQEIAEQVEAAKNEYISQLPEGYEINGNPSLFAGLLNYLNTNVFCALYNTFNNYNCRLNYNDILLLDYVFKLYIDLCYLYSKKPTILNFCLLTGIDNSTIIDWYNSDNRTNSICYYDYNKNLITKEQYEIQLNIYNSIISGHYDDLDKDILFNNINIYNNICDDVKNNPDLYKPLKLYRSKVAKSWRAKCEAGLLDGAIEKSSVGCIFALKAKYGYVEAAQQIEVKHVNQITETPTEIASRHDAGLISAPEKPEF